MADGVVAVADVCFVGAGEYESPAVSAVVGPALVGSPVVTVTAWLCVGAVGFTAGRPPPAP